MALQRALDDFTISQHVAVKLTGGTEDDLVFALASVTPLKFNDGRYTDWFASADARDFTLKNGARHGFVVKFDLCLPPGGVEYIDAAVEAAFQQFL